MKRKNKNPNLEYKQLNTDGIRDLQFKVMVHTFDIACNDTVFLHEDEIRARPYIKSFRTDSGTAVYAINPNKFMDTRLYTLSDFDLVLKLILEDLHIINYEFRRVDIAVDTTLSFEQCYKLNLYLSVLWGCNFKSRNNCTNTGYDCKKRSIYSHNRSKTLAIYDKGIESNGLDPATTRIEFRYLRVQKGYSVKAIINDLCDIIDLLPKCIEEVEKSTIGYLQNQYLIEQTEGYESNSLNLRMFVNKWVYRIFSWNILDGIYKHNCSGKCKHWLSRFRKRGFNLTLYNKSDILLYLKQIKKALRKYKSSNHSSDYSNI